MSAARHYDIERVMGKNDHLFSRATIKFEPLVAGERVLKFGLLPNLRVTRVTGEKGQDLHFLQENSHEHGSFYAVLHPTPPMRQLHPLTLQSSAPKPLSNPH